MAERSGDTAFGEDGRHGGNSAQVEAIKRAELKQVWEGYYPPLDVPSTIALIAALPDGVDPAKVLANLEKCLETVLKPKVTAQEKRHAIQSLAMLGTTEIPDAMWSQNVYGLAFSSGRQHQLKIDGRKLGAAIEAVTEADLQRLAKEVFAPELRCVTIVELKK